MQELRGLSYKSIASRTDILLVRNDKKVKLNIEINRSKNKRVKNKNLTYIYKIGGNFYDDMEKEYEDDIRVIQLNIYSGKNKNKKEYYRLYDEDNDKEDESIKIYNIYLGEYKGICYDKDNDINNDYAMLVCDSYEEMEYYVGENEERKSFMEDLKKISYAPCPELYDREAFLKAEIEGEKEEAREEGREEGRLEGREEGRKEGRKEGKIEGMKQGKIEGERNILNKLVEYGMNDEEIYNITGIWVGVSEPQSPYNSKNSN